MRRCLLILPLLLLAPATAAAGGFATTGLSSTPDGLRAGEPWKVELTILQHGRTPMSDLSPEIVLRDADGNTTTFAARPTGREGRYAATVKFPKAGQWSYTVYDGFNNAMPATYPLTVDAQTEDHPGGPELAATWTWPQAVLPEPVVRDLAETWLRALDALVTCARRSQ